MDDDVDIYSDLPNFDVNECTRFQCKEKDQELTKKNAQLEQDVLSWKIKCEALEEEKKTILHNTSSLMKTARAEIDRKDRSITELRKELEDLKFKRGFWAKPKKRDEEFKHNRKREVKKEYDEVRQVIAADPPLWTYTDEAEEESPEQIWAPERESITLYGERLRKKLLMEQEAERIQKEAQMAEKMVERVKNEDESCPAQDVAQADESPEDYCTNAIVPLYKVLESNGIGQHLVENDDNGPICKNVDQRFDETDNRNENHKNGKFRYFNCHANEDNYIENGFHREDRPRYQRNSSHDRSSRRLDIHDRSRRKRDYRDKSNYRSRSKTPDRRHNDDKAQYDKYRTDKHQRPYGINCERQRDGRSRNRHADYNDRDVYNIRDRLGRRNDGKFGNNHDDRNNYENYKKETDRRRAQKSHSPASSKYRSRSSGTFSRDWDKRSSRRTRSRECFPNLAAEMESNSERDKKKGSRDREIVEKIDFTPKNGEIFKKDNSADSIPPRETKVSRDRVKGGKNSSDRDFDDSKDIVGATIETVNNLLNQIEAQDKFIFMLENDSEVPLIPLSRADIVAVGSASFREEKIENIEKFIQDYQYIDNSLLGRGEIEDSTRLTKNVNTTNSIVDTLSMDIDDVLDKNLDNGILDNSGCSLSIDTNELTIDDKFNDSTNNEESKDTDVNKKFDCLTNDEKMKNFINGQMEIVTDDEKSENSLIEKDPKTLEIDKNSKISTVIDKSKDSSIHKEPKKIEIDKKSKYPSVNQKSTKLRIEREPKSMTADKKSKESSVCEKLKEVPNDNAPKDVMADKKPKHSPSGEKSKDPPIDKKSKNLGTIKKSKGSLTSEKLKDLPLDKESKNFSTDKKSKDLLNKKPKDLPIDNREKDFATERKSKDSLTSKNPKDLSSHKEPKKLATDKKSKDPTSRGRSKDRSIDEESKNLAVDKNSKLSPILETSMDLSVEKEPKNSVTDETPVKRCIRKKSKDLPIGEDPKNLVSHKISANRLDGEKLKDLSIDEEPRKLPTDGKSIDGSICKKSEDLSIDEGPKNSLSDNKSTDGHISEKLQDPLIDEKQKDLVFDTKSTIPSVGEKSKNPSMDEDSKSITTDQKLEIITSNEELKILDNDESVGLLRNERPDDISNEQMLENIQNNNTNKLKSAQIVEIENTSLEIPPPLPLSPPEPPLPPLPPLSPNSERENFISKDINSAKLDSDKLQTETLLAKQVKKRPRIPCIPIVSLYSRKRRKLILTDSVASRTIVESASSGNISDEQLEKAAVRPIPEINSKIVVKKVEEAKSPKSEIISSENSGTQQNDEKERKDAEAISDPKNINAAVSQEEKVPVHVKPEVEISSNLATLVAGEDSTRKLLLEEKTAVSQKGSTVVPEMTDSKPEVEPKRSQRTKNPDKIGKTSPSKSSEREIRSALKTIPSTDPGTSNRKRPLSREKENLSNPERQKKVMIIARRRPVQLEDSSTATTLVLSVKEKFPKDDVPPVKIDITARKRRLADK